MIVTIHQPGYLPWAPFLEKALRSDVFVLLDDVQFEKNSEQNRNRIKTPRGAEWLTVPVQRRLGTLIPDVFIPADQDGWRVKHRRSIEQNYRRAPHFDAVAGPLFALLDRPWDRLLDLTLAVDRLFLEWAGFSGRFERASALSVPGRKACRILEFCSRLGADTYLSGPAGLDYLDPAAFASAGVRILYQHYDHRDYPQLYPEAGFVPRLSALDLFMNLGTGAPARDAILARSGWLENPGAPNPKGPSHD